MNKFMWKTKDASSNVDWEVVAAEVVVVVFLPAVLLLELDAAG